MAAAPAARPPRPARRVVLTGVARRDAAQRLSLALCLVARTGRVRREGIAPSRPGDQPTRSAEEGT